MTISNLNKEPSAVAVEFSADSFKVRLADGNVGRVKRIFGKRRSPET